IIFPVISLYPVVTSVLSVLVLKEKARKRAWIGIGLALVAIVLLAYQPPGKAAIEGYLWLLLSMIVFLMWGLQAYIMKFASDSSKAESMRAESVTFYLMASAVMLIPVALLMTNMSQPINWGASGMYSAGLIQALNAVGFLFFAYAIQFGKAIIVVPMMSLAPVVTVMLSLMLYAVVPHPVIIVGMLLAFISIYLLAE
ncbi:EamA family transporter, partial [bacterium]